MDAATSASFSSRVQVAQRQHQHAEHAVGAVDQGQALLLGEHHRLDAVPGQRLGGRQQFAVGRAHRTLADGGQRHVGQRREIAGAAKAAVFVDDGRQSGGQHRRIRLRDLGPHTGAAGGQCRQPQQHHGPDDFSFDLGTGSGGVGANQAALQLGSQLVGDMPGGQRAEPGGYPVDGLRVVGELLDAGAALGDRVQ